MDRTLQSAARALMLVFLAAALLAAGGAAVSANEGPADDAAAPRAAAAPQAAPVAPDIAIARVINTSNTALSWEHEIENTGYQVWRGAAPYFDPSAGQGNQIKYVSASACGQPCYLSYTDDGVDRFYSDPSDPQIPTVRPIIGDAVTNYFWVVRGQNGEGASGSSNWVGEFDFDLTPGS